MAVNPAFLVTAITIVMAVLVAIVCPPVDAQSFAPAPAPAPATANDGTSIDQGIAYALMIGALLLTYLIHPLDAFPCGLF